MQHPSFTFALCTTDIRQATLPTYCLELIAIPCVYHKM